MARILVIDDDAQVRGAVRRILERARHTVEDVGNGDAGLRAHRERPAERRGRGGVGDAARVEEEAREPHGAEVRLQRARRERARGHRAEPPIGAVRRELD